MLSVADIPEQFYIDLAIGAKPTREIYDAYGLEQELVDSKDMVFVQKCRTAKRTVESTDTAFRARCKAIVQDSLPVMRKLILDPDISPAVRTDAFKTMVKYAGLEPQPTAAQNALGVGLSLTIIAPGGQRLETSVTPRPVIEAQDSSDNPFSGIDIE